MIAIPEEGTFWMPILRKQKTDSKNLIPWPQLTSYLEYITKNSQFKLWNLNSETLVDSFRENEGITLGVLMSRFYSAFAIKNRKKMWGDKTPSFFRMIAVINNIFPQAKYIHLIRDGRDIFLSQKRANHYKRNIAIGALEWKHKIEVCQKALKALDPKAYIEVTYEDLVDDPDRVLKNICRFLGVNYEPTMLTYFKDSKQFIGEHHSDLIFRPISTSSVKKWRKEFSVDEVSIFQTIAGTTLSKFGYDLAPVHSNRFSTFLHVGFRIACGIPGRLVRLCFTVIVLNLSAKLGLKTSAAGKGFTTKKN